MDLDDELDALFNEDKNKDIPIEYPYFYVNLCKLGLPIIYKPIVDSNGSPFRLIQNLRQGSVDIEGEPTRFRIVDKSGFINLNDSQKILVDDINKELDIYCNNHPDEWSFRPTKATVLSYCIVFKLGDTNYNKFKLSVMTVNSVRYIGQLKKFTEELISIQGKDYINKLYSRSLNYNHLIKSFAERSDGYGYEFSFDTVDQIGELNQEIIDRADNLNKEYIDIIDFNEEFYIKVLSAMKETNKLN